MACAIIIGGRPRRHLVLVAGAASMLFGGAPCWALAPSDRAELPFCPVFPPGRAPAIGPSNCVPVPETSLAVSPVLPHLVAKDAPAIADAPAVVAKAPLGKSIAPAAAMPARTVGAAPAARPSTRRAGAVDLPAPAPVAKPLAPAAPQATVALKTPGTVTLDQVAALLGPISGRTVAFALSSADEYKKSDLTHRVTLTWSGSLQALVDQLGAIYGLDVAIDDTVIRFSSRQGEPAASSTIPAP